MEFDQLKQLSKRKLLFRGKSGTGKTINTCKIVLKLLEKDARVLYIDTEAEGSTTLVDLIETTTGQDGEPVYSKGVVENLDYLRASNYKTLSKNMERQNEFDVVVVDTLDHKHSYVLKEVTDAKTEAGADWNEYPQIYSMEKQLMELLNDPKANIIATIDPQSGKMDKPKGAQTNVHGYFDIVIDLSRSGNEWSNSVRNWTNRSEVIGKGVDNLNEAIVKEFEDRV